MNVTTSGSSEAFAGWVDVEAVERCALRLLPHQQSSGNVKRCVSG
jgi:hypothetical protein